MPGQGSGGNVLAALCSFFIPGWGNSCKGAYYERLFSLSWLRPYGLCC